MKSALLIALFVLTSFSAPALCRADTVKQPATSTVEPAKNVGHDAAKPTMEAMSAEFMRKVMETSARIEGIRKEMDDRERFLYESNPKIHALRSQIMEIQKTINGLLEQDEELAALKLQRDILWTIMPVLPKPSMPRPMFHAPSTLQK